MNKEEFIIKFGDKIPDYMKNDPSYVLIVSYDGERFIYCSTRHFELNHTSEEEMKRYL